MAVLKEATYFKKYIGSYDSRRTTNYLNSGIDSKKYTVKPTAYPGISKIMRKSPHLDTTGYLVNNRIHRTKNNIDTSIKSAKQSWEKKI